MNKQLCRLLESARRESELLATRQFKDLMAPDQQRILYDRPWTRNERTVFDVGQQLPADHERRSSSMTFDSDIRVRRDIAEVVPPCDQEWFSKKANKSRQRMIENIPRCWHIFY
jgi:hypothetical protein